MEAENNSSDEDDSDHYSSRSGSERQNPSCGKEKALDLDRIGSLPNPLLLHILSLLPTKYAARTSLLSKKWRYLWTSIPILDFHEGRDIRNHKGSHENLTSFVSFVNRSLLLNQSPNIEKFRVRMSYKKAFASDVDVWLRVLTRKNLKELDLDFSCSEVHHSNHHYSSTDEDDDTDDDGNNDDGDDSDSDSDDDYSYSHSDDDDDDDDGDFDYTSHYHLPMNMSSNISSLTTLKLRNCEILHDRQINWKSLKVLSLSQMSLSDRFIVEMLSGCPSLELLELLNCWYYKFVDIQSERLRKLVISECEIPPGDDNFATTISAPYLQSLDISGFLYEYSVINSSSLVDAKLNFNQSSSSDLDQNHDKYKKILVQLLENLQHVKDLTLGSWCLQVLSMLDEKALCCPLLRSVCLRIDTSLCVKELSGIIRLLRQTPLIETLIIETTSVSLRMKHFQKEFLKSHDLGGESYWSSPEWSFASALLNLKTVRIIGFGATKSEVELLFFLLKNASMLEKMIIDARNTSVSLKKSLEVLSLFEEKALPCSLSSWVCLRVDTCLDERECPGIAKLLALTPLLETLVISATCSDIPWSSGDSPDGNIKIFLELLQNLQHVKDPTLGSWCLQILSMSKEKSLPCPLSSWVCLSVDASLDDKELPGITRLLAA